MATRYWIGVTNAAWSTSASWRTTISGGTSASFAANDTAYFTHSGITPGGAPRATFLDGARTVAAIYGNANTVAITINGGTNGAPLTQAITLGASGINYALENSANNLTIGSTAPITLTSPQTPINAGIRTISISGVLSGTNNGIATAGAVVLSGGVSHTFTGTTYVNSGTLTIASILAGSYASGLSLQIAAGAICNVQQTRFQGNGNSYQWVVFGTLNANTGSQVLPFYSQLIDGTLAGTSTDTLGAYTVLAGQTGVIDTTTGATTGGTISAPIGIASTGVFKTYVKNGKTLTISGRLGASAASAGALLKARDSSADDGTLVLSGTNIYSGGSTINGGTVKANNLQALGTGAVTVSGSTSRLQTVSSLNGKLTIGGKLTMASSGILRIGG